VALCANTGWADASPGESSPATSASPPVAESAADNPWSFSASAYTYVVPEQDDYVQPTFAADHGWLHLEARYNYEDLDTGSAWLGYNFAGGDKVTWELTPMLGGVFGETTGIAPGYEGTLGWWQLELYSEGEYVFDTDDSSENFFYTWSELTLAPLDWCYFGLALQTTALEDTDWEIEPGFLLGFQWKWASLTGYVFNPDESEPTWVVAVGLDF
jgi:hypothetical protein